VFPSYTGLLMSLFITYRNFRVYFVNMLMKRRFHNEQTNLESRISHDGRLYIFCILVVCFNDAQVRRAANAVGDKWCGSLINGWIIARLGVTFLSMLLSCDPSIRPRIRSNYRCYCCYTRIIIWSEERISDLCRYHREAQWKLPNGKLTANNVLYQRKLHNECVRSVKLYCKKYILFLPCSFLIVVGLFVCSFSIAVCLFVYSFPTVVGMFVASLLQSVCLSVASLLLSVCL